MSRRNIFGMSVIAAMGIALPLAGALAQQKSLKEQIVGSWTYTSISDQYEDGKKENPWGTGVKGGFTFDGSGHFTWIIIGEKQASMKSDDPRRPDALTVVQIGSYVVDGNVIKIHIDRAGNSVRDGAEQTLTVSGSGDAMTFTGSPRKDQKGTFSPHLDVARAK